ncbi:nuclear transport factor 2 family protein [Bordetella sp. N]|uniref:nuclear transport factor 2 family protein n=1 Tax=Bordetella sp. N TaxID=1746199 RepID=UPI001E47E34D|nr:nuclear transport factor 2 family protein [Bordetella sp. N]
MLSALVLVQPAQAQTPSQPRNLAAEETNRKLVVDFYNRVFNQHDVAAIPSVVSDGYKQHNPLVPDGRAPFVNYLTKRFQENPQARSEIIRSATDGDLVWLHVHSTANPQDRGRAIVDIFRVKDGKIVEHWDIIQFVPEKSANQNTMF